MKNIFILPTDQPSRLYLEYGDGDLCLANTPLPQTSRSNNQHIYITSDEEIKEGDWLLIIDDFETYVHEHKGDNLPTTYYKKIILTTDPTLIADGIQSIDDEFLEWFVENPSCEYVEIKMQNHYASGALQPNLWEYKIIIPQEEPKQDETGKWFADNADLKIIMERPNRERYSEDEVRELIIKALTHDDYMFCGALVTVEKEIRTANFNIWFEEYKKK
jgi:hypothetical protein